MMVGLVVGGLGIGAWALARYAPPPEGATVGQRAPDYRVLDLATGDSVGLRSAYEGQVTLINVWATWCAPCRAEMPSMERLYQEYRGRGFRIAAVSVDAGDSGKVTDFATELGLTFDLLHDRSGLIQQAYRMIGVPQSFLLDRSGKIVFLSLGEEHWDSSAHRSRIERLLGE
jgi:peroxiredoxin